MLVLSPYLDIYDLVIPKDHLLRKINDLVDFSFIYEELASKYCPDNGRIAIDPIRMFKYLLLKVIDTLSDIDVVERSRYDMSYKYFLGMAPEEDIIDPSSLTKFRKQRLKDSTLLDMLIGKTVQIAVDKGIIKSKTIIMDSTHTKARYNQKSSVEVLRELSKRLRKVVYSIDESMRERFPAKLTGDDIEKEIIYCQELIGAINKNPVLKEYPTVKAKMNLLNETITDDLEHLKNGSDEDARVGHKTADSSFFGYKTHLAMSEERIITAAVVTSGEKNDGKQLPVLVEKSKAAGMIVNAVVGDMAYSEKSNIEYAKDNNFYLVSKLNPVVTQGSRKHQDQFDFNKDAGMYVCKAGHMAIRKGIQGKKCAELNQVTTYFFDIEKCRTCPMAQGCYTEGAKSKTYSVTIKSESHSDQAQFQETDYFKEKAKERYKIEAKNSELKNRHGYDTATAGGLGNMELQGALSIFAVNLKRIITLVG
jgi:transposase